VDYSKEVIQATPMVALSGEELVQLCMSENNFSVSPLDYGSHKELTSPAFIFSFECEYWLGKGD